MSRLTPGSVSDAATLNYRVARPDADPAAEGSEAFDAVATRVMSDRPSERTRSYPEVEGYELLEQVGRGGMGVVYKARHRGLNRVVALKMIRNGDEAIEEHRLRFLQEARAVAMLLHPNIVPIHDLGLHDDALYLSLEYVEGGTLHQWIGGRPQSPEFAAAIVGQLADGIHHAHSFGIIHRDLKPANILLSTGTPRPVGSPYPLGGNGDFPLPKITDFGLAKRIDCGLSLTATGMVAGTPAYMAPEQIHPDPRRPIAPGVDVYALGTILYEMLTGRPPFTGNSAMEILRRVADEEPLAPRALQPSVPRDLETICLKCLEKDPHRRYRTGEELAADLRRYQQGKPILARPVGRVEGWMRWARRNPLVAGSVAGVILLFLVSFALVSGSYLRAEQQRQAAEDREKAERRERYRANVAVAGSAIQMNNSSSARNALDAAPEEYRGWEWKHFACQLDTARDVIPDDSHYFAVRRDGRRLAVSTPDRRTELRELPSGRVIATTKPHAAAVRVFQFSDDGATLAEGAEDGEIRLLDGDTLQTRSVLRGHEKSIFALEFDPSGRRLLSLAYGEMVLHLWDIGTGHLKAKCPTDWLSCRFAPDGKSVVIGANDEVRSWDGEGEPRTLFTVPGRAIVTLAWSPDGKYLAASTRYPDNKILIWERSSGTVVRTLTGHKNTPKALAFSPDGSRLASASFDQTLRLWDPATGNTISEMRGHTGHVYLAAFRSDGSQLISGANDGTVRLWDGRSGHLLGVLRGHNKLVQVGTFTRDGKLILTRSDDGELRIWDLERFDASLFRGHTSFVYDVAVSPDGDRVASVAWDGTLCLWDASNGRLIRRMKHDFAIVSSVAFDRHGRHLLTMSRDLRHGRGRMADVWDAATGERLGSTPLLGDYFKDSRATYSPTGDRIAVAEATGAVRLFDGLLKQELARYEGLRRVALDVAYRPDGLLLATGSEDGTVRLLDATTLNEVAALTGHRDDVLRVVFSPDGSLLASGSADQTVRIWDVESCQLLAELKHGSPIHGLAFTPDGTRLAAGCSDNTIRLWDTTTFKEVAELLGHSSYVHALAFSTDGTRLFSASGDSTVRVWETLSVRDRAERRGSE